MKKLFLAGILAILAFNAKAQAEGDIIKVGDTMPAFTIVSDNGNEFKSSALQGKVILINLFATWCPPCQKELAVVKETLWPKYKNNANFTMLVIGREHNDAELKEYNEKKDFEFPLYPDKDRKVYNSFASKFIPRTYLIDKGGKVIFTSTGYKDEEFDELMGLIEKALK